MPIQLLARSLSLSNRIGERTRRAKAKKTSEIEIKSLINEGKRWGEEVMERQAVTTSHKQIDFQPVSEQHLLWKDYPFVFMVEHDVA